MAYKMVYAVASHATG